MQEAAAPLTAEDMALLEPVPVKNPFIPCLEEKVEIGVINTSEDRKLFEEKKEDKPIKLTNKVEVGQIQTKKHKTPKHVLALQNETKEYLARSGVHITF